MLSSNPAEPYDSDVKPSTTAEPSPMVKPLGLNLPSSFGKVPGNKKAPSRLQRIGMKLGLASK